MKSPVPLLLAALLAQPVAVRAQGRPNDTSICDYYAEKTVGANTAENQQLLMALILSSALLGPYSNYSTVKVDSFGGCLVPTTWDGDYVDLNGYFNGGFASANTGLDHGVAVSYYDDGGLDLARQSKPGLGNTTSNQYRFFTHVYSYFGTFLGCSHIGSVVLPNYAGKASMYEVHKYMDLNNGEMSYFVDQAVRGLISLGFLDADAQFVNATLTAVFNRRCAPAAAVVPASAGPQLQAICVAADCTLAVNDTCAAYAPAVAPPAVADAALVGAVVKAPDGSTSRNGSATAGNGTATATTSAAGSASSTGTVSVSGVEGMDRGLWVEFLLVAALGLGLVV